MAACIANLPGTSMELIGMSSCRKRLGDGPRCGTTSGSRPRMPRRNGRERLINHHKRNARLSEIAS